MLFKYFFTVQTCAQIILRLSSQPPYSLLFKKEKRWKNDVAGKSVDKWRTCDKMGKHGAANTAWETFVAPLSSLQRAIIDFPTTCAQVYITDLFYVFDVAPNYICCWKVYDSNPKCLFCEQNLICCRRQSGDCRRHFGDSQWRRMAGRPDQSTWNNWYLPSAKTPPLLI